MNNNSSIPVSKQSALRSILDATENLNGCQEALVHRMAHILEALRGVRTEVVCGSAVPEQKNIEGCIPQLEEANQYHMRLNERLLAMLEELDSLLS